MDTRRRDYTELRLNILKSVMISIWETQIKPISSASEQVKRIGVYRYYHEPFTAKFAIVIEINYSRPQATGAGTAESHTVEALEPQEAKASKLNLPKP